MLLERIVQRYQSRSSITGTMIVPSCVHEGSPPPPCAGLGRRRPHEDGQEVGHPGVHYRHLRAGGQTRAEPSRSTRWGVASLQWQGGFKPVAVATCPNALTSVRVRSYLSTVRRRDSGTGHGHFR